MPEEFESQTFFIFPIHPFLMVTSPLDYGIHFSGMAAFHVFDHQTSVFIYVYSAGFDSLPSVFRQGPVRSSVDQDLFSEDKRSGSVVAQYSTLIKFFESSEEISDYGGGQLTTGKISGSPRYIRSLFGQFFRKRLLKAVDPDAYNYAAYASGLKIGLGFCQNTADLFSI